MPPWCPLPGARALQVNGFLGYWNGVLLVGMALAAPGTSPNGRFGPRPLRNCTETVLTFRKWPVPPWCPLPGARALQVNGPLGYWNGVLLAVMALAALGPRPNGRFGPRRLRNSTGTHSFSDPPTDRPDTSRVPRPGGSALSVRLGLWVSKKGVNGSAGAYASCLGRISLGHDQSVKRGGGGVFYI